MSALPLLNDVNLPDLGPWCFSEKLQATGVSPLRAKPVEILQINVGKKCNQACQHCHVEAGPNRTEVMSDEVMDRLISLMEKSPSLHTVDITGGAPELHPRFFDLVKIARALNLHVIDRCNLTILFEKGQEQTAQFLAEHGVEVIASLPCYSQKNVDAQRGKGVFHKSIEALKLLNHLGYGQTGSGLKLNLVYNPVGAFLPPAQGPLQADYKQRLWDDFGIVFNGLFTITNMPIKRFAHQLHRDNQWQDYMNLLSTNFNASTVSGLMCTQQISVGYDGQLYDCDFNQMLEVPIHDDETHSIWRIASLDDLEQRPIQVAGHCLGCTAGAGSSCGGAISLA